MMTVYEFDIDNTLLDQQLKRMIDSTFKLLPLREEKKEWVKPLCTLKVELFGLSSFYPTFPSLLQAANKMEGMSYLGEALEFYEFRRTIFEICGILAKVKESIPLGE